MISGRGVRLPVRITMKKWYNSLGDAMNIFDAQLSAPQQHHASVTRRLSRVAARMALDERAVRATREMCSAHEAIIRLQMRQLEEVAQAAPAGESGMARTWFRHAVRMLQVSSAEVVRLVRTGRAASSWWWSWRWSWLGSWRSGGEEGASACALRVGREMGNLK